MADRKHGITSIHNLVTHFSIARPVNNAEEMSQCVCVCVCLAPPCPPPRYSCEPAGAAKVKPPIACSLFILVCYACCVTLAAPS